MRKALDHAIRRRLAPFRSDDWASSALIVAPHPDDETLGCGGVICKKISAGAEVRFVFVTDGSSSHTLAAGPDALRRLRNEEALEAARRLGVGPDHVAFLDFADGHAADHVSEITRDLTGVLQASRPQSVYVVHCGDPTPDHRAVFASVTAAIRAFGEPLTVFEYPVWYWYHWPWVGLGGDPHGLSRKNLAQTVRMAAGLRSLSRLNVMADVSDVAAIKRRALAAHRTQMERAPDRPDWPVLGDLGGGDFLARLTSDYEAFLRYEANA